MKVFELFANWHPPMVESAVSGGPKINEAVAKLLSTPVSNIERIVTSSSLNNFFADDARIIGKAVVQQGMGKFFLSKFKWGNKIVVRIESPKGPKDTIDIEYATAKDPKLVSEAAYNFAGWKKVGDQRTKANVPANKELVAKFGIIGINLYPEQPTGDTSKKA